MAEVKGGQRFRALADFPANALTQWDAPFTGGSSGVLPAGELVEVLDDPVPGFPAVGCRPVRYEALHTRFVSEEDRAAPKYSGYYLVIALEDLVERFERIADAG